MTQESPAAPPIDFLPNPPAVLPLDTLATIRGELVVVKKPSLVIVCRIGEEKYSFRSDAPECFQDLHMRRLGLVWWGSRTRLTVRYDKFPRRMLPESFRGQNPFIGPEADLGEEFTRSTGLRYPKAKAGTEPTVICKATPARLRIYEKALEAYQRQASDNFFALFPVTATDIKRRQDFFAEVQKADWERGYRRSVSDYSRWGVSESASTSSAFWSTDERHISITFEHDMGRVYLTVIDRTSGATEKRWLDPKGRLEWRRLLDLHRFDAGVA